jgi:hypothetical protein
MKYIIIHVFAEQHFQGLANTLSMQVFAILKLGYKEHLRKCCSHQRFSSFHTDACLRLVRQALYSNLCSSHTMRISQGKKSRNTMFTEVNYLPSNVCIPTPLPLSL